MQSLVSVWPVSFSEGDKKRQEPLSQSLKRELISPGNEIIGKHVTSRVHRSNNSLGITFKNYVTSIQSKTNSFSKSNQLNS
ncbi:hypothetical protein TorRG33x02_262430 [Trema orientale]|uniref:Uncharacterized protein n=1 Tax=Trema orientale TaxID=63057 RepID=A0A2P5D4N3_TREOI|nr:hypothetical protein TorRG33x02_262430 [Trema orientale]